MIINLFNNNNNNYFSSFSYSSIISNLNYNNINNTLNLLFSNSKFNLLFGSLSILVTIIPFFYHSYLLYQFQGEVPISFSWIPILGHAIEFGTNPISLLQKLSRDKNGKIKDIFGLVLAGKRIILLNNPLSFNAIFTAKKELSFDVFTRQVMINVFGATPETIHGTHLEAEPLSRKLYTKHLLNDEGCSHLTDRMQLKLGQLIKDLPNHETIVDMFPFLNHLIFKAAVASLFNSNIGDDDEIFKKFIDFDDTFAIALAGCPMKFLKKGYEGREMILKNIFNSKANEGISDFILERYNILVDKCHYPTRDIQASNLSMLWASVGNTMPATFWVIYYLLNSPKGMQAVRQEIETVLNDKIMKLKMDKQFLTLTLEDLNKMVVIDSCISEALRLSSGSLIMREAVESTTLTLADGTTYNIRKGDNVGIFPPILHRDERFYSNPETFQYDRFLNLPDKFNIDGAEVPQSKCFLPFGGGISYCPGRKFARNEIKTLVIHLLLKYNMVLDQSIDSVPVTVDYSRAGLGIFQPKECHLKLKLSPNY